MEPGDLLTRCLDTPADAPRRIAPPRMWERPNTRARAFGFTAEDRHPLAPTAPPDAQAGRFADLLKAAHERLFPPHLFPPLLSEPYVLRAAHTGALVGSATDRFHVLDWIVPDGVAFTVQEAHLRAASGFVACAVGFVVTRAGRPLFQGDELRTRHKDGSESVQPEVLKVSDTETIAVMTTPFATTLLPGERIGLDLVCTHAGALSLSAQVQLRGYLFPSELLP